jgi:hypothetical protein
LWRACLEGFQLPAFDLHPEELVDLQLNVAKSLLARFREADGATDADQGPVVHKRMQAEALALDRASFADVGEKSTLARRVAGVDRSGSARSGPSLC